MSDTTPSSSRRFLFKRLLQVFYRPSEVFEWLAAETVGRWFLPLLLLSLATLVRVALSGWLQARAAMMGNIPLPPDWQYYTPDMQAQYMQAAQATQSPIFVYVIPAVMGLTAIWLGWGIVSSLLHLAFTISGGRGSTVSALNLVAWAGVPYTLREGLRILYIGLTRSPIVSTGLAGFVTASDKGGMLFLSALLSLVDIFLVWHIFLLVRGAKRTENLSAVKATVVTLLVFVLVLAGQAGLSYVSALLGGMMATRPYYF